FASTRPRSARHAAWTRRWGGRSTTWDGPDGGHIMIRALFTAGTGMQAQQLNLDVVANNLANVNTPGFKRSRVDFQDLLYQTLRPAGVRTGGGEVPTGVQVGHGTRPVATQKIFAQGNFQQTDNPLDLVIEGDGFFQVARPDGTTAYTRAGSFKRDSQG